MRWEDRAETVREEGTGATVEAEEGTDEEEEELVAAAAVV